MLQTWETESVCEFALFNFQKECEEAKSQETLFKHFFVKLVLVATWIAIASAESRPRKTGSTAET